MKRGRKPFGFYPDEARIVTSIGNKRRRRKGAEGPTSYGQIARELNAEKHRTQMGKEFTAQTVKNILNPASKATVKKKYLPRQQPVRYWTEAEMTVIFESCRTEFERAAINVLVGSGVRAGEFLALEIRDLVLKGKGSLIQVRCGLKNSGGRSILISQELAEWLWEYIRTYRGSAGRRDRLFIQPRGGGVMSYGNLYDLTTRIGRRTGLAETANPHSFRHTFATLLYQYKQDINFVAEQLGHTTIKTTAIYAKCLNDSKLQQMGNFGETLWPGSN